MNTRMTAVAGVLAVSFAGGAYAQSRADAAFTATGESCSQITWSDEALEQYPNIARACRDVMERDGQLYVQFEGEVRQVQGNRVTVDFVDGDTLTLTPPENLSLTIDGRSRRASELRPGDELTFFVPERQLAATFFAGEPETSEPTEVPISPATDASGSLMAQAEPAGQSRLPRTAGLLPLAGLGGLSLLGIGGMLTLVRRLRRD